MEEGNHDIGVTIYSGQRLVRTAECVYIPYLYQEVVPIWRINGSAQSCGCSYLYSCSGRHTVIWWYHILSYAIPME